MAQAKNPHGIESTPARNAVVLSVSPHDEDHDFLERILRESRQTMKTEWRLIARQTLISASCLLREEPIPVVVCESDLLPGTWREMLEEILRLPDPPLLIVTSRLADERLWAEALNLGAYDLLSKPLYAPEVNRIIGSALQHWQDRHERQSSRTKRTMGATGE